MSVNDEIAEAVRRHTVNLQRFDANVRREILKFLEDIAKSLAGELSSMTLKPGQNGKLQDLLKVVRDIISTGYSQMADITDERLGELAELEHDFTLRSLTDAIPVEIETTSLSGQQLKALASDALVDGAVTRDWFSRQSEDLRFNFARTIREGMVLGEDTAQMVRRIRGYKKRDGTQIPGIMTASKNQAESLVRTAVAQVSNQSALATYQANSDLIKSCLQISTLDSRVSDICLAYSGKEWDIKTLEPIGHTLPFLGGPPRHWRCRSRLISVTKSWEELGFAAKELDPSTRASMDGQVPSDMPINKWLETKSDSFINELLGPNRAALWKSGKMSLTQMIDQTGRPLTVAELRKRYGLN